jgi:hypothetical protein
VQQVAQAVVRDCAIGLDGQRTAVTPFRLLQLPEIVERIAKIAVCLRVIGLEGKRLRETTLGLLSPMRRKVGNAETVQGKRLWAHVPVRPFDQLDRVFVPPEVVREHPEEMQGVRVVRLRCQDLPIECLCRGQSTGLMMLQGNR